MPYAMRQYPTLQMMYENYSNVAIAEKLIVEKHEYRLIGCRRKGNLWVHVYRCDEEQHSLLVYLRYNIPFLIKPIYSINGIALDEVWEKHAIR